MKKIIAISLSALAFAVAASAQTYVPTSAYFVDGHNYRHQLNPALASSRSYFSIPLLGNTNANIKSNLGINTFLYPNDGNLVPFMNGAVSSEQFLGNLKRNNRLSTDFSTPVFSVGAWGKDNGFTTVEMNVKVNADARLPYDLFDFVKNLGAREEYNISNLGLNARSYMEIAVGHSRSINEHLRIGAKVKFLSGLVNADMNIDNMKLRLNEDKWTVNSKGSVKMSGMNLINIPTKAESGTAADPSESGMLDFSNISFLDNNDPTMMKNMFSGIGYGAALDLGAYYKFGGMLEGLTVSAAVIDLGFISWGKGMNAVTGDNAWEFSGFDNISFEDGDNENEGNGNSIKDQFEGLKDGLVDMLNFYKAGDSGRSLEMLSCTVNIGAEYEMPFYRRMSVGFLSTTRISGHNTWSEGRFSLNLSPTDWFDFSTSYGISSFGSTWGAILNFNLPGFGLFIGTDNIPLHWSAPINNFMPVPYRRANVNLSFGLSFNVSGRKDLVACK